MSRQPCKARSVELAVAQIKNIMFKISARLYLIKRQAVEAVTVPAHRIAFSEKAGVNSRPVSTLESIVKALKTLPESKLKKAARYVGQLKPYRRYGREERLTAIKATAGCLGEEDGRAFEYAASSNT